MNPLKFLLGLVLSAAVGSGWGFFTSDPAEAVGVGVLLAALCAVMSLDTGRPRRRDRGRATPADGRRARSGVGGSGTSGGGSRSSSSYGDDGGAATFGAFSFPALSGSDTHHSSGPTSGSSCSSSSCSSGGSSCGGD